MTENSVMQLGAQCNRFHIIKKKNLNRLLLALLLTQDFFQIVIFQIVKKEILINYWNYELVGVS